MVTSKAHTNPPSLIEEILIDFGVFAIMAKDDTDTEGWNKLTAKTEAALLEYISKTIGKDEKYADYCLDQAGECFCGAQAKNELRATLRRRFGIKK